MTGREDLLVSLRNALLMRRARELGCGKIMRGEGADTLATRIISETSKVCAEVLG